MSLTPTALPLMHHHHYTPITIAPPSLITSTIITPNTITNIPPSPLIHPPPLTHPPPPSLHRHHHGRPQKLILSGGKISGFWVEKLVKQKNWPVIVPRMLFIKKKIPFKKLDLHCPCRGWGHEAKHNGNGHYFSTAFKISCENENQCVKSKCSFKKYICIFQGVTAPFAIM